MRNLGVRSSKNVAFCAPTVFAFFYFRRHISSKFKVSL